MFDAFLQGAALLASPTTLLWISVGVLVSSLIAIVPGIGGVFTATLLLPLVFILPPEHGLPMLLAAVAVSGTANTVTSVLFGVPGSSTGVATILDGYPMTKKGEGPRAVAAGVSASVLGGIIGTVALACLIPVVVPVVLAFGPAEFFVLTLAGVIFIAYVTEGSKTKSLIAGLLGIMASFVGLEASTGTPRYTFDQFYLWDGIPLIPAMIGLFAVAEMMNILRSGKSPASDAPQANSRTQILRGIRDPLHHWRVTLQSSIVGVITGVAPGIGGAGGQYIAYAQAMKTSPRGKYYGTGEVEGVIAADATGNAESASALVPTLAFGIPGNVPMAIVLAGMISGGIAPGPEMLDDNLDLVWLFVLTLIVANILAAALTLGFIGPLSKLSGLKPTTLAPAVLVISLIGAFSANSDIMDIWVALGFGLVGYVMLKQGYSRATFIIGLVLGSLVEQYYLLSAQIYGWAIFTRPIVLIVGALIVLGVAYGPVKRSILRRKSPETTAG